MEIGTNAESEKESPMPLNMEDMVIASVDDHIIEPPTMFDAHVPKDLLAKMPRYVTGADGHACWSWEPEGKTTFNIGLNAVVGRPKNEYGMEPANIDQMRRGTWDAKAHVDDMNVAGIFTSVCFPTFIGFDGSWLWQAKDKALAERVVQAYNDWHLDEWCAPFPGRYIPTAVLPLWDVDASIRELTRLVKKGCRSVTFPSNPSVKGLKPVHDPVWEPFWAFCNDHHIVLNCHIGTGQAPLYASEQSPISAWISSLPMAISTDASDLLHLRALMRYPNLKFSLSEGGIGWIPYFLERADFTYHHHKEWVRCDWGGKLPSEVFREHFLSCFIEDRFGCRHYDEIGEDIIAFECDYPHSDCTWPDVAEGLWDNVKDLPETIIDKISYGNVMAFFGVDTIAEGGGREHCTVGALRQRASGVDTSLVSLPGKDARVYGDMDRPVTAADVWVTLSERKREDD
jgi:predicted TIM-barrel fold metal-dependent hydrolase